MKEDDFKVRMCLRESAVRLPAVVDITAGGGWLASLESRPSKR